MANKKVSTRGMEWNLGQFYKSINDPQIENDIVELDTLCTNFNKKYSLENKEFWKDDSLLLQSLKDMESIEAKLPPKPIMYLSFSLHMDSSNTKTQSLLNLISNRATKILNKLSFYSIELGKTTPDRQKEILNSAQYRDFNFILKCAFEDAKHLLSESEEKIISLKELPAADMWNDGHDKQLSALTVKWKGKILPIAEAQSMISGLKTKDREKLHLLVMEQLKSISNFSEAEINAVVTNKKINDELRGYKNPQDNTIRSYRNDPETVNKLVDTVTRNFKISNRFYKAKAKILKLKYLRYCDRSAKNSDVSGDFSFEKSKESLINIFGNFDKKYADILQSYIKNKQIDVFPRKGKRGGAYCWGTYANPTFVLLNHTNNFNSYNTFAHEMGHAFHTELSRPLGPINMNYSTSTAETASTFFESLAFEDFVEKLPNKQKVIALHSKIQEDVSTIFRQIACFNFEKDIHKTVREKGYISKEELSDLHNKNMKAYLGSAFKLNPDDGYFFVSWSHIRNFFYVYSYAYGLLISKVLLKRYRQDKSFKDKIEKFLMSGGKDTPENIFESIGINIKSGELFEEGMKEIENDIKKLESLI